MTTEKDYNLPSVISVALTTERIEMLNLATNENLEGKEVRRLLGDLLSDRANLRKELSALNVKSKSLEGQCRAVAIATGALLNTLDGS